MNQNGQWLVKSRGRILGPFQKDELDQLILEFEVAVLDEVSLPFGRWEFVRDHNEFIKIVEEVRIKNLSEEGDTTTIFVDNNTDNDTMTLTEPINGFSDDLTEEIPRTAPKEIVYDNIKETPTQPIHNQSISSSSFVFEGDKALRSETAASVKFQWVLAGILISAILGFVGFKHFVEKPKIVSTKYDELVAQAKTLLFLGDYKKSLNYYREAHQLKPDDKSIYLYLGTLLVQVEKETVVGKRLLLEILGGANLSDEKRALTAIGLSYLYDADYAKAKDSFQRALDIDHLYGPAVVNLGVISYMRGEYQKASSMFQLAFKDGRKDGALIIMLLNSYFEVWKQTKDRENLLEAEKVLEKSLAGTYDYQQELMIYKAYLSQLLEKDFNYDQLVIDVMQIDSRQTALHRHNVFLYRGYTKWNFILNMCDSIVNSIADRVLKSSFHAFCFARAGSGFNARRMIEEASLQKPNDPLVQAVYALVMNESQLSDQANVAINRATREKSKYKLPYILRAVECESRGDNICAKDAWTRVLQRDSNSLAAIAGYADQLAKEGKFKEARSYIRKGLRLSENYIPFIKIDKLLKLQGV